MVCDPKQIKSTVENSKEVNNHSFSLADSDDDFRPLKKPTKQLSYAESQQSDSEDELLTHDEVARPFTMMFMEKLVEKQLFRGTIRLKAKIQMMREWINH